MHAVIILKHGQKNDYHNKTAKLLIPFSNNNLDIMGTVTL